MKSVLVKTIPGYERYRFHSNGDIWDGLKKEYKSGTINKRGYCFIKLNGVNKGRHYWIALAFIPNPENKPEVHHIDKNPLNNCVENLMWVTREEHLLIHKDEWAKVMSEANHNSPKLSMPIEMLTMDWKHEAYYESITECERQTGINHSNICKVLTDKRECTGKNGVKHRFRYINKEPNSGSNCL